MRIQILPKRIWGVKMNYTGDELLWIAICDDETKSVMEIKEILMEGELEPGDFKISVFSSGEELLNASVGRYNLLILDMMLPGKHGRDVAKEYRRENKDGLMVFCTGKSSPIPEDFKTMPYRYMRKEHARQMRKDLLETVEEMYRRKAKHRLQLTQGKTITLVEVEKILYLEITKNGSAVYYLDKANNVCQVKVKERLKELYPQLVAFGFEFSHNSYLVNCHYLKRWDNHELELINGTRLSISRAREKSFKEVCMKYIF
ncbi:MAG: LytTR family DNA-binding domain-containing protein [Blautia sp.]|nr:LytTR family DNA-binding domain-containing protein [Blautia sp.]